MGSELSLGQRVQTALQYLWPQRLSSGLIYRLTRIQQPWFKNNFIRVFSWLFKVNLSEALYSDLAHYAHFNAFFTRKLRPDARPLSDAAWVCPVDGAVSQAGAIEHNKLLQAKGQYYTLEALLAGDSALAAPFHGGLFATLYLAPRDYHRIHMPTGGQLRSMWHVPGQLFSVSPLTALTVPNLFARNERVICLFETDYGPMVLILVGAINVSSMDTVWAGTLTPPYAQQVRRWDYPSEGEGSVYLQRGEEMGRFNMGSTVIVLLPAQVAAWDASLQAAAPVRMGQALAQRLLSY